MKLVRPSNAGNLLVIEKKCLSLDYFLDNVSLMIFRAKTVGVQFHTFSVWSRTPTYWLQQVLMPSMQDSATSVYSS